MTHNDVRTDIVEFLKRELVGPDPDRQLSKFNNGEEVLRPQDPPRMRYSSGVIFPSKAIIASNEYLEDNEISTEEPDNLSDQSDLPTTGAVEAEDVEQEINRANEYLPSAMGITAFLQLPSNLAVYIEGATYKKKAVPNLGQQVKGVWQQHYFRMPFNLIQSPIDSAKLLTDAPTTLSFDFIPPNSDLQLTLHLFSRPCIHSRIPNARIVTFTLINKTLMNGTAPKDEECMFQAKMTVCSDSADCFLPYPEAEYQINGLSAEEASNLMLFRDKKTFAIGHGCAVSWSSSNKHIQELVTTFLPTEEIKPIIPRALDIDLKMETIASDSATALNSCQGLLDAYKDWIDSQKKRLAQAEIPMNHCSAAKAHIQKCEECHTRMAHGIQILRSNPTALKAFAWMNEAMKNQQVHYKLEHRNWIQQKGGCQLEEVTSLTTKQTAPAWRPFQLAFILMTLPGIVNQEDPSRDIVDLIWFPTGGGKTEAYLGLTAFTIFHRRLLNPWNAGTTALMRYTLRLLTTQQFERAAALICAAELIRKANAEALGLIPISLGLWVGGAVTPNTAEEAKTALRDLRKNAENNKFILLSCPWCRAAMGYIPGVGVKGYQQTKDSMAFKCENPSCDFHKQDLPLYVIDSDIYEKCPTLVIGTVDKFAMLPWRPEARRLFAKDKPKQDHQPPDLIIQDELHLISGSLGSMVAAYEGTIEALCEVKIANKVIKPKVVASTATICQATSQVKSLYGKNTFIFPPPGLEAGNSFFAQEAGNDTPGRLYVGVFATAVSSHITAQIRTLSSLLQAVNCTALSDRELIDPYWTLLVYFNSLRELGHAATLLKADIREYINATWSRLNIPKTSQPGFDQRRFINYPIELTSRIPSSKIPETLKQLFVNYPSSTTAKPVDVCLASNMIQVGLDVSRLGLMAVVGQPKTTSEYIQATSRVGRQYPGLVVTIYNPSKPRDRSHFEHFKSYHQSLYQWVEPTSITPFAIPVRERSIHAQLVTLIRFLGSKANAERPSPVPDNVLFEEAKSVILARIRAIDPHEEAHAEQQLVRFIDKWKRVQPPNYGGFSTDPQLPLMHPSGMEQSPLWNQLPTATPTSMRNVDTECSADIIQDYPKPQ